MILENLKLMSFEGERSHQKDGYQGTLLDQTACFFEEINQSIMLSRVQRSLVVHYKVEVNDHIIFVLVHGIKF